MSSTVGGDHDLISSLPDAIICHILSFLLTKQVVATSTLSKRWTHLWRSVPVINFKGEKPVELCGLEAFIRFNNAVYSVLLSRDSNSIQSFSLKIHYGYYGLIDLGFPSVLTWINHVVQHNVESIDICVYFANRFFPKLPISILSCKTLVVLKIKYFTMEGFSSVRLPSLKILRMKYFRLLDARGLVLFLSGCPILEDLFLSGCPILEDLFLSGCPMLKDLYTLDDASKDSLTYQDGERLSLSKLTRAQMPYSFWYFLLKALHNVEELHLEINKVYRNFDEIPTFHNLTKLKLQSINSNWNLLFQMLNHCPNLQHVELNQGTTLGSGRKNNVQQNWVDPTFVPQCLLLHLKTCSIWDFEGEQDVLQLATYILKNARVLHTMMILCRRDLKIQRKLYVCPKASPACKVLFKQ